MSSTLRDQLDSLPRKPLAMRGESLRKKLADPEAAREIGAAVARAFDLMGLTAKEVAFALGYSDQSSVSRWISGSEPPQLERLWALNGFRESLVIALAEGGGESVKVRYVVEIARLA